MCGILVISPSASFDRLSGPQFRWLFEQLESDAESPEVVALCRELQDHAFDFGSVETWNGESVRHLSETVERFRERLKNRGASLLRPGADVAAWVRIVEDLATLIQSDPRLRT